MSQCYQEWSPDNRTIKTSCDGGKAALFLSANFFFASFSYLFDWQRVGASAASSIVHRRASLLYVENVHLQALGANSIFLFIPGRFQWWRPPDPWPENRTSAPPDQRRHNCPLIEALIYLKDIINSQMNLDDLLRSRRGQILQIAAKHGARNVRVFGSLPGERPSLKAI